MSLFFGGTSQFASVDPEKIKLATVQFEATSETFRKILYTCNKKCIAHEFGEGELNTGEANCVDRCVSKYFTVNRTIGTELQYARQFNVNRMPEYQKVESMRRGNDVNRK